VVAATPMLILHTHAREATQSIGAALGRLVQPGQVIALRGDLGAGKTTFVQGLAAGLGVTGRVSSPTFVLVNEYIAAPTGVHLIHVDTYRLGDTDAAALREADSFGLEEILNDESLIVAIEWAERVADLLPPDHLQVELEHVSDTPDGGGERTIRITAHGPQSAALCAALAKRQSA
jgi:tRNA threonylcarbamoyladenosine biosynthesis protein TsaE